MRTLVIKTTSGSSDGIEGTIWEFPFAGEAAQLLDSEMLHHALSQIDPGDEYTVTFKNV